MNDWCVAGATSLFVHGLIFCAQVGTASGPAIEVNRAPSSIELSFVATQAALAPLTEKAAEGTKEKAAERTAAAKKNTLLNTQQGALGKATPLSFRNAAPVYPRIARERGWEGEVLVKAAILESGECGAATVEKSSGYAVLDTAALKAVRGWRFEPARRGTRAFTSTIELPIVFRLKE